MGNDFGEAFESASMDEALSEEEVEQFDDEDLECVRFGISPEYLEEFTGKNAFWHGSPTNDFIEYLVEVCPIDELKHVELKKLSDTQRELVEEKLGKEPEQGASYPKTDEGRKEKVRDGKLKAQVKQMKAGQEVLKETLKKRTKGFKELVDIFIEQGIKADLSESTIEQIKELRE